MPGRVDNGTTSVSYPAVANVDSETVGSVEVALGHTAAALLVLEPLAASHPQWVLAYGAA
jgi:hypothetical protein